MKLINKVLFVALLFTFGACEMAELDLLDNPNAPTPETASVNDLYNNIQLEFRNFYSGSQGQPGAMTRMYHAGGSYVYLNYTSPTALNGSWFNAYADLFPDIDALLVLADERGLDIHAGSAKIMKAYTLMTLVDLLNDVPLSESLEGTDIISPKADAGSAVYDAALALLDEAIAQLDGTVAARPAVDNYYGGDPAKWIALANTLKLRAALNKRLVDPSGSASIFNSVVDQPIIDETSEDFQFNYGNQRVNPNSRHPFYQSHYEIGDGDYLSNYYMWKLRADKEDADGNVVIDPRIRFYFYRKVEDSAEQDATTYSCHWSILPDQSAQPDWYAQVDPRLPYCIASSDGYTGRDHLSGEGIPPDGPIRTSYGLYPGGGQFDDDSFEDTRQMGTTGGLGQGIWPIMLASFSDFMRAEAALTLDTKDDARALLESGIRKSINKVIGFKSLVPTKMAEPRELRSGETGTVEELFVATEEDIDAYVDLVLSNYDAAGSNAERLDIVINEFYIAAWGNGLESYNMYRRTGYPSNMAPALEPDPGPFPRSLFYPNVHTDRNANATQKSLTDPVFWDDGSADLY